MRVLWQRSFSIAQQVILTLERLFAEVEQHNAHIAAVVSVDHAGWRVRKMEKAHQIRIRVRVSGRWSRWRPD